MPRTWLQQRLLRDFVASCQEAQEHGKGAKRLLNWSQQPSRLHKCSFAIFGRLAWEVAGSGRIHCNAHASRGLSSRVVRKPFCFFSLSLSTHRWWMPQASCNQFVACLHLLCHTLGGEEGQVLELSVTLLSECGGEATSTAEFSVEVMAVTTPRVPVDVLRREQETDTTHLRFLMVSSSSTTHCICFLPFISPINVFANH